MTMKDNLVFNSRVILFHAHHRETHSKQATFQRPVRSSHNLQSANILVSLQILRRRFKCHTSDLNPAQCEGATCHLFRCLTHCCLFSSRLRPASRTSWLSAATDKVTNPVAVRFMQGVQASKLTLTSWGEDQRFF